MSLFWSNSMMFRTTLIACNVGVSYNHYSPHIPSADPWTICERTFHIGSRSFRVYQAMETLFLVSAIGNSIDLIAIASPFRGSPLVVSAASSADTEINYFVVVILWRVMLVPIHSRLRNRLSRSLPFILQSYRGVSRSRNNRISPADRSDMSRSICRKPIFHPRANGLVSGLISLMR